MSGYEGQRRDLHRLKVRPQPVLVLDDSLHAIKHCLGRVAGKTRFFVVGSGICVARFSMPHGAHVQEIHGISLIS